MNDLLRNTAVLAVGVVLAGCADNSDQVGSVYNYSNDNRQEVSADMASQSTFSDVLIYLQPYSGEVLIPVPNTNHVEELQTFNRTVFNADGLKNYEITTLFASEMNCHSYSLRSVGNNFLGLYTEEWVDPAEAAEVFQDERIFIASDRIDVNSGSEVINRLVRNLPAGTIFVIHTNTESFSHSGILTDIYDPYNPLERLIDSNNGRSLSNSKLSEDSEEDMTYLTSVSGLLNGTNVVENVSATGVGFRMINGQLTPEFNLNTYPDITSVQFFVPTNIIESDPFTSEQ